MSIVPLFKNVPASARERSQEQCYRTLREAYARFLKADSHFIMALNDYVETGISGGVIMASKKQEAAFLEFSQAKAMHEQYITGVAQ